MIWLTSDSDDVDLYHTTLALTPFWDNQTTFWASAAVTNTSSLGYTYPDFEGVDVTNTDAARTAISNRVNELYGTSVFGSFAAVRPQSIPAPVADTAKKVAASSSHIRSVAPSSTKPEVPALAALPSPAHSPAAAAAPQQHPSTTQVTDHPQGHMNIHPHPTVVEQSSAPPDRGIWDWTVRVEVKKYELGTSFSVLIFLGQVPENPREWRISPNYVGGHHAFVNSGASSCANCSNQQDLVVEGFVHLNHAIVQHSGLGSLEPAVVEPYLTHNLHWKVQKVFSFISFYICECVLIIVSDERGGSRTSVPRSSCDRYSVKLPPRRHFPCFRTCSSPQPNHARSEWR
jgi:tyrosinase